jgi:hypothetical protein
LVHEATRRAAAGSYRVRGPILSCDQAVLDAKIQLDGPYENAPAELARRVEAWITMVSNLN